MGEGIRRKMFAMCVGENMYSLKAEVKLNTEKQTFCKLAGVLEGLCSFTETRISSLRWTICARKICQRSMESDLAAGCNGFRPAAAASASDTFPRVRQGGKQTFV